MNLNKSESDSSPLCLQYNMNVDTYSVQTQLRFTDKTSYMFQLCRVAKTCSQF